MGYQRHHQASSKLPAKRSPFARSSIERQSQQAAGMYSPQEAYLTNGVTPIETMRLAQRQSTTAGVSHNLADIEIRARHTPQPGAAQQRSMQQRHNAVDDGKHKVEHSLDPQEAVTDNKAEQRHTEATLDADEEDKKAELHQNEASLDSDEEDKKAEAAADTIHWEQPTITHKALQAAPGRDQKWQRVNWSTATYISSNANGASTCVEKPFDVKYKAVSAGRNWKLGVKSIKGGATVTVNTGGSRDPIANPPVNEPDAKDAVDDMKGYYARGARGNWHTEAASKKHEMFHYREWQQTANHYWPLCRRAITKLSTPKAGTNKAAAQTALELQADLLIQGFATICRQYWFTLGDGAGDRPYAAGQRELNNAVRSVQSLARSQRWRSVAKGTVNPPLGAPCYQPWLPYAP